MESSTSFDQLTWIVISITLSAGGVLFAAISTVCVITISSLHQTLKRILISFSTANMISGILFTYDIVSVACYYNTKLDLIAPFTLTLSLSHILLSTAVEYLNLTSRAEQNETDFTALIGLAWLMATMIGCTRVLSTNERARLLGIVFFIFVLLAVSFASFIVIREERKREVVHQMYIQRYFRGKNPRCMARVWKRSHFAATVSSYICCCMIWTVLQFGERGAMFDGEEQHGSLFYFLSMMVLSFNIFVPSCVSICIKYQQMLEISCIHSRIQCTG